MGCASSVSGLSEKPCVNGSIPPLGTKNFSRSHYRFFLNIIDCAREFPGDLLKIRRRPDMMAINRSSFVKGLLTNKSEKAPVATKIFASFIITKYHLRQVHAKNSFTTAPRFSDSLNNFIPIEIIHAHIASF